MEKKRVSNVLGREKTREERDGVGFHGIGDGENGKKGLLQS